MPLDFHAVFDINEYQNIQDILSKNLGVGSITVLPSGKPITNPSNFCCLCENYLRKSRKGRSKCFRNNAEIGKPNPSGPIIKQCMDNKGLWNAGVSIVVQGVHIASWCIGQVKNEQVDENHMLQFAREIGADINGFKEALDQVPSMSKERFEQIANIVFLFANQLAEKAHKNLTLNQQISEIKNTNEMLFQSQKRFRLLFEKSNDAIFVVKLPEGKYIDANESASKLTGRTHEEILKLKTKDLSPKDASNRLKQTINSKKNGLFEQVEYLRPDGTVRYANLNSLPIDQHTLFGVAQDITEQLKASAALKHSHDLMQYVIEHSRSAIAVHDKELKYIYVSKKYLEEYGIQEDQIIGKHHYEVFPDLPQKWRKIHQMALQGIVSSAEEDPYERDNGTIDWTRWECRPWYDQNNEIGGIIVYTEVITRRKQMEITLRESEEKYKFLFYGNPQPSWIYDLETLSFLEVNNAATIHYGYSREEFLKMTLKDIRPREEVSKLIEDVKKITPEYNNGGFWRHVKKNGDIIYVEILSHAVEYEGRPARHVLINDITERLETELQIRAAQKKAEESDRLKSAFLANMSHEIRTPLNSILGFSELIVDPSINDEDKKEFIETIKHSSDRLMSLIGSILDLSKIEAGEMQLINRPFYVNELLTCIYKNHFLTAKKKGLELILNTSVFENDKQILSDMDKLTQILNNLINNAIKFTNKGFIEFGIHSNEDFIQFYVGDSGIGIPADFHERIFDRFLQIDSGLSRKFEGSGLGLTIAKNLVELMGGNIWLESSVGSGSTFYFTIPKVYNN